METFLVQIARNLSGAGDVPYGMHDSTHVAHLATGSLALRPGREGCIQPIYVACTALECAVAGQQE